MKEDGFTLVEVLVAFTIMTMVLILSFDSFSEGLFRLSRAEQTRRDITEAQQIMTALETSGSFDPGPAWRIEEQVLETGARATQLRRRLVRIYKADDAAPILETILLERAK
jgi:type II secretory pathway pseudopilin PulG